MRILFVNRMAAMVRGGGETFDLEMARHLVELGCQTEYLSGIPMTGRAAVQIDHPRVHLLRSPYTGHLPWDRFRLGWRIRIADFRCFEILAARWILQHHERFDVIQICEMPPLITELAKRHCPLPTVIRITAPDFHDAGQALQKATAVIASGTSLRFLRDGIRPDVRDIPNGVDLFRFRPQASDLRERLHIPADAILAVHVARFQAVKNHAMLLRAFRRVLDAGVHGHLLLAGGGPLEGTTRADAARLGLTERTHFLGEVPFQDVPGVYQASDINLVSSHSESFSFSALEGMACALPLVTTATEWVPGLIGVDQGGATVALDDAEAFAKAWIQLANDPARRAEQGTWNRQRVERDFGWTASARKLLALYASLPGVPS
jgi:glycosyltransferase involved in cell wall biosynthesis